MKMKIKYQWTRYWSPPEGRISLTDHGFLEDPTGEFGKYISPNLATLPSLADVNCLFLLGEPGIGKSTEIEDLFSATSTAKGDEHTLWLDLKNVMTPDSFIEQLTKNSKFVAWAEKGEPLYLFLDSFDEGTFSFPRFANYFLDLLTKNHTQIANLYLRISCRTALWPSYMEGGLVVLWGDGKWQKQELCPLTKKDVEAAAIAHGIDKDKFMSEVHGKGVSGLAGKPLTLNFLIDVFQEQGQLPDKKSDIYAKGCELLAQEPDVSKRVNPAVRPTLNLQQRLAVAERIAVATLIGGKPTIVIETDGDLLDGEIGIAELHGNEFVDEVPVTLGDEQIKEVLNTGLFSARGDGKIGWAHQTYGEFLAARYLVRHKLPWKQIQSFLFQDPLKIGVFQVIPQLYEVGAWLASLDASFFDNAVLLDPEFLLLSDANVISDQQKEVLTAELLSRLDHGDLFDRWETFNATNYKKLNHADIAKQLEPYISDASKGIVVRRAAMDIVLACEVSAAEATLVKVALDDKDDYSIRARAANAIANMGSDDSRLALKPLADAGFPDDTEDEVKGAVLKALWPKHITNQALFALITPTKKRNLHGTYYYFVTDELAKSLRTEDVLPALTWIEQNALTPERLDYFNGTLSDAIMLKAWEEISTPAVLEKFAGISYARLKEFSGIVGERVLSEGIAKTFQEKLDSEDESRRSLIKKLIEIINTQDTSTGRKGFILLHHQNVRLILGKDLSWLIEWIEEEENEEIQKIVAEIIGRIFDIKDAQQIELVNSARQKNKHLAAETSYWFTPIELASDSAKQERERWEQELTWQTRREKDEKEEILKVISPEKIIELLEKSEAGDMDCWWRLNVGMCMYDHQLDDAKFDDLPGWKVIGDDIKTRIIGSGKKYLSVQESKPEMWLGLGKIYFPAVSGYREIKALYDQEPEYIEKQDAEFWKRWAPITVGLPLVSNDPKNGKIIGLAYKHAPEEVITTLEALIDYDAERHNGLFINDLLEDCLDERMRKFLLDKAKQEGFSPKASGEIIRFLLSHDDDATKEHVKSKIKIPLTGTDEEKQEVVSAAASLLQNATPADWEFLWDLIGKDNDFGRTLVFRTHDSPLRGAGSLQNISESRLADLYIWLTKEFPPEEYSHPEGGGSVTPQISIGDWRDSVLRVLADKGTAEACKQVERVAAALPQYKWIKQYTLIESRRVTLQKSWQPTKVADIFRLAENQELRLVNSPDELMDIVLDSIARFEKILHAAQQPRVVRLWNQDRRRQGQPVISWPKDELDLSDELASHLREDLKDRGIIIGREVEITRVNRLDIHIAIFSRDHLGRPKDSLETIIEVKGCWHRDLNTSMEAQLAGKYLSVDGCRHGIYLIGWFSCAAWNNASDTRKRAAPSITIDEAREKFRKQAEEISIKSSFRIVSVVLDTTI
jgi:hypothetical protein